MAKKAVQAPADRGNTAAPPIKMSRAVREALTELGRSAVQGDVEDWLRKKYPMLEINSKSLSTTLSNQRKKVFGGGGGSGGAARSLTFDEMMKVKEAAAQEGGLAELSALVDRVGALAEKVGGFNRLQTCLRGLREIRA